MSSLFACMCPFVVADEQKFGLVSAGIVRAWFSGRLLTPLQFVYFLSRRTDLKVTLSQNRLGMHESTHCGQSRRGFGTTPPQVHWTGPTSFDMEVLRCQSLFVSHCSSILMSQLEAGSDVEASRYARVILSAILRKDGDDLNERLSALRLQMQSKGDVWDAALEGIAREQ
jgi:hypothetical protein